MTRELASSYGADYFQNYSPRTYERNEYWLRFFGTVADRIVAEIAPARVLDAGCALGLLVEALRDRNVDATGVDLSSYAIEHVYGPVRPYCRVGSIADEFDGRYDLITCVEVIEHLDADAAEAAIANFCRHTDDVLFSSTPVHFRDPSHLNVQPGEYWAERFARHGFYRDLAFDASFVCPWAVRFRRGRDPLPRVIAEYERFFSRLAVERSDLRSLAQELREQATAAEAAADDLRRQVASGKPNADLRAQLAALEAELAQARGTVGQMERSMFWRLRSVWVALRRLVRADRHV